jgi:hypothetical protein
MQLHATAESSSWNAKRSNTCANNTPTWTSSSACRSRHRNDEVPPPLETTES